MKLVRVFDHFLIGNVAQDSDHWIVLEVKWPLYRGFLDVSRARVVTLHEKLNFGRHIHVQATHLRMGLTNL